MESRGFNKPMLSKRKLYPLRNYKVISRPPKTEGQL